MDSEELLAQLADIHLPEAVSYWPPAPGWWALALIIIVAAVWLSNRAAAKSRQHKIRSQALAELEKCYSNHANGSETDPNTLKLRFVNEANSVFKRVALYHFPNDDIAGLQGDGWVDFIKEKGESELLDDSLCSALSHGRFRTSIDIDVDKLNEFGKQWISSLYSNASNRDNTAQSANLNQEVMQ